MLSQDFSKEKHWDVGTYGKMQINVLVPELRSHQAWSWGDRQLERLILGKTSTAVMDINGIFLLKGTGGGIRDLTLGRESHDLNVCVSAESGMPQPGCALLSHPDGFRKTGKTHPSGTGETWDNTVSAGGRTGHSSSKMTFIDRVSGHNKTLQMAWMHRLGKRGEIGPC